MAIEPLPDPKPDHSTPMADRPPDNYPQLVEQDLLTSFRFKPGSFKYSFLRLLFKHPISRFAEYLTKLDEHLTRIDVASMAQMVVQRFTLGVSFHGQANLPSKGPALVVANHPGWIDSFVALTGLTRPDVYFLAGAHPMLENLPHFTRHLIFVDSQSLPNRTAAIRQVVGQLRSGHVVVIFPKGLLEPDPAVTPGARQSILDWNDSIGIFLNKVPGTVLQPMLISQMVHPRAWNHWSIRLIKDLRRRQQFATVLQFALSLRKKSGAKWKVTPRVDFGAALTAYNLSPTLNPHEISRNLKELMNYLFIGVYPNQD